MKPDATGNTATVGVTVGVTRWIREVSLCKKASPLPVSIRDRAEEDITKVFAEMAADPKQGFDWIDASVLAYQMGRKFVTVCKGEGLGAGLSAPHGRSFRKRRAQAGGCGPERKQGCDHAEPEWMHRYWDAARWILRRVAVAFRRRPCGFPRFAPGRMNLSVWPGQQPRPHGRIDLLDATCLSEVGGG